jgi:transcriptional regulator with XRE-family HTH domain
MTPKQLKQTRLELGFSPREMAQKMVITERAYRYKEAGERPITERDQQMIIYIKHETIPSCDGFIGGE